jgi:hypothetical protein
MKTHLLLPLVSALALLADGCATVPPVLPPSAAVRGKIGRVAVVTFANKPFQADQPASKAELAQARKQMVMPGLGEAAGITLYSMAIVPHPYVGATVLASIPAQLLGGSIHDLIVGEPDTHLASNRQTMSRVAAGIALERELPARLLADIRREAPYVVHAPHRVLSPSVSERGEILRTYYDAIASEGADTVLELKLYDPGLHVGDISNRLSLSAHIRVRLLSARDGTELFYAYLEYQSASQRLADWAENDAQRLRAELDSALGALSAEITALIFTRPAGTPPDERQLASVGLKHRPPLTPAVDWLHQPILALPP